LLQLITLAPLGLCAVCGRERRTRLLTCSDRCHEKLIDRLVEHFGEYKKVVDAETGIAYRVPTRYILEHGLRHEELHKFPRWEK